MQHAAQQPKEPKCTPCLSALWTENEHDEKLKYLTVDVLGRLSSSPTPKESAEWNTQGKYSYNYQHTITFGACPQSDQSQRPIEYALHCGVQFGCIEASSIAKCLKKGK
jgi:hypothetical protein